MTGSAEPTHVTVSVKTSSDRCISTGLRARVDESAVAGFVCPICTNVDVVTWAGDGGDGDPDLWHCDRCHHHGEIVAWGVGS